MFGYAITDFERSFGAMDELRQRLGRRAFVNGDTRAFSPETGWPRTSVYDTKDAVVLVAEVPGLTEKDLEITLKEDVLTLAGQRRTVVPEGYQEQPPVRFSRSFTLPARMATDTLTAVLKDGILTVRLPKVPEAQARKIEIKAA